ncbi:uncharacterized protein K452DRAFT_289265 [Aplosporella prunicola CBS 121167]|uniref:Uncharacterized protein n=1 Tax=Aplosporella prunicola CBS 121167 TaxID=1176127 RepID=A0A6A6B955_9PEZI|nr:uncharacterized protein K452DRAFT_289265 [Aplosporella prunicola CBS 121167]KAF2139883.1 hypothetical protein K452DRAFT_289265 [Aplosporella prunicola CBS 121167]
MHRKLPVSVVVYNHLFPNPRPEDPSSFSAHLSKNLVGEVRIETATFYGSLDSIEARYPGLNYSHPPHRKRLGRFPHHARLFRAFDELRLTEAEIASLCRWEGTLWARERYERDEGIRVQDTTANEIGPWVDTRRHRVARGRNGDSINVKTDIEVAIEDCGSGGAARRRHQQQQQHHHLQQHQQQQQQTSADADMMDDDEDNHHSEDEADDTDARLQSIGIPLNQRLMAAAARREHQHQQPHPMDADWEKYLERAQERGEIGHQIQYSIPAATAGSLVPTNPHDRSMPPAPPSAPA